MYRILKDLFKTIIFLLLLPNILLAHDPSKNELANKIFGSFQTPAKIKSEPIGFYAKGCLAGGVKLPERGPKWLTMKPKRNRNWGHPTLIEFVKRLSISAEDAGWAGLYIGDIGGPRGGPMPYGHQSHQTGLDVDIWLSPAKDLNLSIENRNELKPVSIRSKDLRKVNKNWTHAHMKIIKAAALDKSVDRIFITAPAKIWMCKQFIQKPDWLQKVRPYWGHHEHFHVRLKCPEGSTECKPQTPTVQSISKTSSGCDETLTWWVTKALEPPDPKKKKVKKKPRRGAKQYLMNDLPEICKNVIHYR